MYISRVQARSVWTLGLSVIALVAAAATVIFSDWSSRWLAEGVVLAGLWAVGWLQPRLLQFLVRGLFNATAFLARLARIYFASLLFSVLAVASIGARRVLSSSDEPIHWRNRAGEIQTREVTAGSDAGLFRAAIAPIHPLLVPIVNVFGWLLKQVPPSMVSGRINYGNYTLQ